MIDKKVLGIGVLFALVPLQAGAQSVTNMPVLKGLAPVSVLMNSYAGRAALGAHREPEPTPVGGRQR